jgi:hypothetical protein
LLQIGGIYVNQTVSAISNVDVGENRLTGTIPPLSTNIWNTLRFDNNQLSGTLPPSLVDRNDTVELDVSSNRLTGSLSASFGLWKRAVRLHFSNNGFRGTIPDSISRLPLLQELRLDRNSFTGNVSNALCEREVSGLPDLDDLTADCLAGGGGDGETGRVVETPCACCRTCCNDDTGECRKTTRREDD